MRAEDATQTFCPNIRPHVAPRPARHAKMLPSAELRRAPDVRPALLSPPSAPSVASLRPLGMTSTPRQKHVRSPKAARPSRQPLVGLIDLRRCEALRVGGVVFRPACQACPSTSAGASTVDASMPMVPQI